MKRRGREIYREFHGRSPSRITHEIIDLPDQLVLLGRAVDVGYESDKLNGCPPEVAGKMNKYRHKMPRGNKIYSNHDGSMLVIIGPKLRVTSRGIEN